MCSTYLSLTPLKSITPISRVKIYRQVALIGLGQSDYSSTRYIRNPNSGLQCSTPARQITPLQNMRSQSNTRVVARSQGQKLEAEVTPLPTSVKPNQLLIRLKAIAINPADVKMVDQGHRVTSWPIVPGLDGAGIVEAVGSEVTRFKQGDEVLAQFKAGPAENGGGSYQKFGVVSEDMAAKKPSSLDWEDAAGIPVCYFTAMVGLGSGLGLALPFLKGGAVEGLQPLSILVLGGSSALGASAIQLLRLAVPDCKILVPAATKHHNLIKDHLDAHEVLDRSSSNLVQDIKAATPGAVGVDAIFDAVGAAASEPQYFDAFKQNGPKRYAQVWTGDDEIKAPEGVDSVLFRSRDFMQVPGGENIFSSLQTLLADQKYKAPLPVRQVGEGIKALETGLDLMRKGVSGEKLVVTV